MKRFFLALSIVLLSGALSAQTRSDLYGRFREAASERDEAAFAAVIADWEKLYPDDAELFSVRANYYFMQSMEEGIVAAADGFYPETRFDQEKLDLATGTLAKGIASFPDRLDLRLGKVSMHLNADETGPAVKEVQAALERSIANDNKWIWTLDESVGDDGMDILRDSVQDYLSALIDAEELGLAEEMIDTAVRLYPQDAVFLSDKGSLRYFSKDLEGALKWFQQAHDCDPADRLISNNLSAVKKALGR